jgi:release factor glutamine methyltransferase
MTPSRVRPLARGTPTRDALDGAITAITAAGCESPRLDAELLLADALGVSRERLLIDGELLLAGSAVRTFQDFVRRRSVQREPVAYILGRRHFRHLELAVDRRALIPRPETELLVEAALALPQGARVLDLGTGSGAVALALKDERPDLELTGSDLSREALELAQSNAQRLSLEVRWLSCDLLEGIPEEIDAILSNPPYVPEGERSTLSPEILRHEPAQALFAGSDGLEVIRRLIMQVTERPAVRFLALEVGAGQAPTVGELMRVAGFASTRTERDLAGIERVVVGKRPLTPVLPQKPT